MIESVDSCLTCENLVDSLKCKKHDLSVEINNVCNVALSLIHLF